MPMSPSPPAPARALVRLLVAASLAAPVAAFAQPAMPIADMHLHYSHDAVASVPADDVIGLMRQAGLRRALVSSSDDAGTQKLLELAPDIVVPSLRPYRSRGEIGTWFRDPTVIDYLEQRLARHRYAAIGEFHLYGADADLPVPAAMVALARRKDLILHAHSDADAVKRLFRQWPEARIVWAHAGFDSPENVRAMLRAHPKLWADLAFRSDHASGERIDAGWREAFLEFPDRFMVGTDTFTPERLFYIPEHAAWSRGWLATLPAEVGEKIAWRNAETLLAEAWPAPGASAAPSGDPGLPACAQTGGGVRSLEGKTARLVYRTEPAAITLGQPFRLLARLCPGSGAHLSVDATMPEHRHGMNYAPKLAQHGDGLVADGMLFHMAGRWQLVVQARQGDTVERFTDDIVIR
jgi:hypothetical protein